MHVAGKPASPQPSYTRARQLLLLGGTAEFVIKITNQQHTLGPEHVIDKDLIKRNGWRLQMWLGPKRTSALCIFPRHEIGESEDYCQTYNGRGNLFFIDISFLVGACTYKGAQLHL